ncbi:MAG: hypothetical protein EAY75_12200 [Bacteroidetes bacterium]|nr:MAG: hypothetical protein EAY75_12200 [Bacteroidota bacterium]
MHGVPDVFFGKKDGQSKITITKGVHNSWPWAVAVGASLRMGSGAATCLAVLQRPHGPAARREARLLTACRQG